MSVRRGKTDVCVSCYVYNIVLDGLIENWKSVLINN